MSSVLEAFGLNIDSPLVTRDALNYRPPTWPPPKDFPVVVDARGVVVSRYGDPIWKISPWAKRLEVLNFGDGPQRKGVPGNTPHNADLLRRIAGWWLWGPRSVRTPGTLVRHFATLRPIFILCSAEGISAADLLRFPAIADRLPEVLGTSNAGTALTLLHTLYEQRHQLGFVLLDPAGLRRLEAALPEHESRQTPYIPPRIWTYQVNRLRDFLDDFRAHQHQVEACYRFCLDAYATSFGSLAMACRGENKSGSRRPFSTPSDGIGVRLADGRYYGPFSQTARKFGIDGLLQRWCTDHSQSFDERGIHALSKCLTMAGKVGIAYLLNFSLMRIGEAWSLRTDCLEVEQDESLGPIYLLRGATTKTVEDNEARWVTSPSAKVAVEVSACVARLRMIAADANPNVPSTEEDLRNPYLVLRPYEPWATTLNLGEDLSVRPHYVSYQSLIEEYPRLFDPEILRITKTDLQIARLVTPNLDPELFDIGKVWPLSWHQLRRTGAVNMQASGLVSDASIQYQLKHATRAMSRYYGQGYSRVRLSESARVEYIRTMYEVIGKEVARLLTDRFVSPYGEDRKADILRFVNPKESKKLVAAAREGKVSWRETLLGGCTKRGPCEYGGIDNVARCGGGDGRPPCVEALFDREREPDIRKLGIVVAERLSDAPEDSPYRESLKAQHQAIENALSVITTGPRS